MCSITSTQDLTTLSCKYKKLQLLGFWILSSLSISQEIREECFQKMQLYNSIKEQIAFYENFYTNEKQIAKQCKKTISIYNKEREKKSLPIVIIPEKIIGRDQLLREAFIDKLIAKLTIDRESYITYY